MSDDTTNDIGADTGADSEPDTAQDSGADTPDAAAPAADTADRGGAPTAAAVLNHIVTSIVDDPAAVRVATSDDRGRVRLDVRVGPGDLGRVIGRRGRTAQSIRAVVRAAATRDDTDVDIEFLDD